MGHITHPFEPVDFAEELVFVDVADEEGEEDSSEALSCRWGRSRRGIRNGNGCDMGGGARTSYMARISR